MVMISLQQLRFLSLPRKRWRKNTPKRAQTKTLERRQRCMARIHHPPSDGPPPPHRHCVSASCNGSLAPNVRNPGPRPPRPTAAHINTSNDMAVLHSHSIACTAAAVPSPFSLRSPVGALRARWPRPSITPHFLFPVTRFRWSRSDRLVHVRVI
jgi:hypothetical protein